MKRSKHSRETAERLARCEAEDRAAAYLEKFPPIVAFTTALAVQIFLAELWSIKDRKMLERGDNPVVFQISDNDIERMRQARAMVPRDVEIDLIAMHEIMRLFDGLPYDQRWKVASAVAWRAYVHAFLGQRQRFHNSDFAAILDVLPKINQVLTAETVNA
jgi:hydrogenase maturation factor HypF (carbamoyltransferase family)